MGGMGGVGGRSKNGIGITPCIDISLEITLQHSKLHSNLVILLTVILIPIKNLQKYQRAYNSHTAAIEFINSHSWVTSKIEIPTSENTSRLKYLPQKKMIHDTWSTMVHDT